MGDFSMRSVVTIGLALASVLAGILTASPPATAAATANPRSGFIKSCETQMYMSAAACTCLADKADKQLDATAIAYLSLPALDVAHSTAMSKAMSAAEMGRIDRFMKTAPDQCQAAQ
jgi:hypothetical protein